MKHSFLSFLSIATFMLLGKVHAQTSEQDNQPKKYYTFELSDKVTRQSVTYKNRFGITLSADLYIPDNLDKSQKHAAIVIGGPYGGVKEQGPGVYAQNMAERGFVAIAFDASYNGESGGAPRRVSSPDIFTEDFSAGVDFLGTQPFVDRSKVGAIGICGSGGFALNAAQADRRIKAIATASMYDISRSKRSGRKDAMTEEQRSKRLDLFAEQRWKDVDSASPKLGAPFPSVPVDKIPEGLDPISGEFFEYYGMKRGHHPNATGAFTVTSDMSFFNFPLLNYLNTISPRPVLFLVGENAFSQYFSEDAYKKAAEPKELLVVPNARHIDLYDRTDLIPFDKLELFFKEHLK